MYMDGAASSNGGERNNGVESRPTYVVGWYWDEKTQGCGALQKSQPPLDRRRAKQLSERRDLLGPQRWSATPFTDRKNRILLPGS